MSPSTVTSEYQSVSSFLLGRINYERIAIPAGSEAFKLQVMRQLLSRLDDPQSGQKIVHVAGTKGKGSTAMMVSFILAASGYRVGLYTSPHLDRIEERVRVDGEPCTADQFVELMQEVIPVVEQMDREAAAGQSDRGPTFFEIMTALGLLHFGRQGVDFTVLEVGLGGRLDSTNVVDPMVSVITSISFDHTDVLGETLAAIAAEKAGIVKPGVPVVCGVDEPEPRRVIEQVVGERRAPLFLLGRDFWYECSPNGQDLAWDSKTTVLPNPQFSFVAAQANKGEKLRYDNIRLNLLGKHQVANAAVAIAVTERLKSHGWPISEAAIRRGLLEVRCPGRVEVISCCPLIVIDAAHNVASVGALVETLSTCLAYDKGVLVFATSRDKDCTSMLRELLPMFDHVILTRFLDNPRAMPLDQLEATAERVLAELQGSQGTLPVIRTCDSPKLAWQTAQSIAATADLVCVCGSSFIAGEIRRMVVPQDADVFGSTRAADAATDSAEKAGVVQPAN